MIRNSLENSKSPIKTLYNKYLYLVNYSDELQQSLKQLQEEIKEEEKELNLIMQEKDEYKEILEQYLYPEEL